MSIAVTLIIWLFQYGINKGRRISLQCSFVRLLLNTTILFSLLYIFRELLICFGCVGYMQTQNFVCKLLDRTFGAVWTTVSPPSGPLSLRMLFSDENGDDDESWVVPVNNIPQDWKPGDIYDTGVQVN